MANDVDIVIGAEDKASKVLDNVAGNVGRIGKASAMLGPAMIAGGVTVGAFAAGVAALSYVVMTAADRLDELSSTAFGLGESTDDLRAFQFAMSEAGNVDASKSIDALQKLQRAIGEIAAGDNEAGAKVLEKLNLDAQALSLQGPIDQFKAIQGAIGEIENGSERAAMAQKLFGKSAAELMPALLSQTDALKESEDYARRVGAAMGDEGAAAADAMNDAVGRIGTGLEGLSNTVAVALAPAIEETANLIAEWLPPIVELAQEYLPMVVDAFGYVADSAIDTAAAIGLMTQAEKTFAERIEESRQRAADRAEELKAQREAIAAIVVEPDNSKAEEAAQKSFDATIAALERRLTVAQLSEDFVRSEEELAKARNDAEREAITLLQQQIAKQEELNALADQEAKDQEKKKKEDERIAQQLQNAPTSTAAKEGRLLTRGDGSNSLLKQQLDETRRSRQALDAANAKLEAIYQEEKRKGVTLEVAMVN